MRCRRCGATLQQGALICPECGARQRRAPQSVRCAYCHGRIPLELVVCPHCGRDVRPAGPRLGLWLLVAVIVVLAGLWGLGRLPVDEVRQEILDTRSRLAGLVQVLDLPTFTPTHTPATRSAAAVRTATPTAIPTLRWTPTVTVTLPGFTSGAITQTITVTATAVLTPTVTTASPTAAGSPAAAETPAPAGTPTAAATSAVGTPPATPVGGSPTAVAAGSRTYVVQAGDTLAGIGARFGVPWETIAAANKIADAAVLQVGQVLTIPLAGALPPTATPRPRPTATPVPPTATPLPALPAPVLDRPGDGSGAVGADAEIELGWQPVAGMPAEARYQVTIEWLEGGQKNSHSWTTSATAQRMPPWLFLRADQPARRYVWYVTVVQVGTDGKGGERLIPLSPPSAPRTLSWQ